MISKVMTNVVNKASAWDSISKSPAFQKLECVINLVARAWVANIFFKSGMTKMQSWDVTVYLFEYEYQVPMLPPGMAALIATFVELVVSSCFALGLGTRVSALILLIMTAVIQFTYLSSNEHMYWAIIMAICIVRGGGNISVDKLIMNFLLKANEKNQS